jgi:TRAP-type C4-dicarboxylate transport system permease small subunit
MTQNTPKQFPSIWRIGKTALIGLGTFCLYALVLLTFADVLSRNLFNRPIPGVLEVTEYWLMVPMVFIGIWWAGLGHEHVRVTMLTEALGRNSLKLAESVVALISILILLRMAWLGFHVAYESMSDGEYAGAYKIVIWPVRFVTALGFLSFALVIAKHIYLVLFRAETDAEEHMESPEAL